MKLSSAILSPAAARILPWLVAVAFFMQRLDGTILNTALPGIAAGLDVSPLHAQSVIVTYMLTAAVIIPLSGWLADRFGSKRVFVWALFLFTLGSVCCALSPSLDLLVASRIVQGAGGALMVPVGRLSAIRAFPRSQLVQVLGFITIPGLVGPLLGPALGGFLVQYASWHWIFLINLPVGLLGGLLALRFMPELPDEGEKTPLDLPGFLLFGGAVVLFSLAVEGPGNLSLSLFQAVCAAGAGVALLTAYGMRSLRVASPLFDLSLFRNPSFSVGIIGNMFSRLGSRTVPFLLPLFLQLGAGFSPVKAGMTMIPLAFASFAGKQWIGRLVDRFGFRVFLTANTLLLGAMLVSFRLISPDMPYALLLLLLTVYGTVNSMQYTAMNSVTLIDLSNKEAADGNMLLSVAMQVSSGMSVAAAAALLRSFTAAYGGAVPQAQMSHIFGMVFTIVGVFCMFTSLIFSRVPRGCGREKGCGE